MTDTYQWQWWLLATVLSCAISSGAQTAHSFDITLTPLTDDQHTVTAIRVEETVHGDARTGKQPFTLSAPIFYVMLTHVADRISDLSVTDNNGPVELSVTDDSIAGQPLKAYRHWQAKRAVVFPVQISFVAAVEPNSSHSGPPFGMRPAGGGVAGSGGGFLLLPDDGWTDTVHLHWDLAHFLSQSTFWRSSLMPTRRSCQPWMRSAPASAARLSKSRVRTA